MDLQERKKRAAIIAASHFLLMEDEAKTSVIEHPWGKMGLSRTIQDRDNLQFSRKLKGIKQLSKI